MDAFEMHRLSGTYIRARAIIDKGNEAAITLRAHEIDAPEMVAYEETRDTIVNARNQEISELKADIEEDHNKLGGFLELCADRGRLPDDYLVPNDRMATTRRIRDLLNVNLKVAQALTDLMWKLSQ